MTRPPLPSPAFPAPLARAALRALPPAMIARIVRLAVKRARRKHPRLIANLERLPPAVALLEPTDVPLTFALRMGKGADFTLIDKNKGELQNPDAVIAGSLAALVALLEGRVDGDTLFFARELTVTGDTSTIVALRNTLDREEIDLTRELLAPLGPFARPAATLLSIKDSLRSRLMRKKIYP